jgi:hypothetical protein
MGNHDELVHFLVAMSTASDLGGKPSTAQKLAEAAAAIRELEESLLWHAERFNRLHEVVCEVYQRTEPIGDMADAAVHELLGPYARTIAAAKAAREAKP